MVSMDNGFQIPQQFLVTTMWLQPSKLRRSLREVARRVAATASRLEEHPRGLCYGVPWLNAGRSCESMWWSPWPEKVSFKNWKLQYDTSFFVMNTSQSNYPMFWRANFHPPMVLKKPQELFGSDLSEQVERLRSKGRLADHGPTGHGLQLLLGRPKETSKYFGTPKCQLQVQRPRTLWGLDEVASKSNRSRWRVMYRKVEKK